jgi:hypothetical protein
MCNNFMDEDFIGRKFCSTKVCDEMAFLFFVLLKKLPAGLYKMKGCPLSL